MIMYVQCRLSSGSFIDVRWIPAKFAEVGKMFTVKADNSIWRVDQTFGKVDEKQVIKMRDVHKSHRKGTDI